MPSPVVMLDRKLQIIDCNTYWLRANQMVDRTDAIGKNFSGLFPDAPSVWRREFAEALKGRTVRGVRTFFNGTTKRNMACNCVIAPWRSSDDEIGGITLLVGWSEFGFASKAESPKSPASFSGSLLDLAKQVA
jgi:hypothetical protein